MVEVLGRASLIGVLRQPYRATPAGGRWTAEAWLERRYGSVFFALYDLKVEGELALHAGVRFTNSQVRPRGDLFGHALREIVKQIHRQRVGGPGPGGKACLYRVVRAEWAADAEPGAAPDRQT
jgi:hypothetical protein